MPPETAVVPPTVGVFSYTSTEQPLVAAVSAAVNPAPPLPSTTTSTSWSQSVTVSSLQRRIADNSSAALTTASLPPVTTSSRWVMRLMHVGGDGGRRATGTPRPYVFGSTSPCG